MRLPFFVNESSVYVSDMQANTNKRALIEPSEVTESKQRKVDALEEKQASDPEICASSEESKEALRRKSLESDSSIAGCKAVVYTNDLETSTRSAAVESIKSSKLGSEQSDIRFESGLMTFPERLMMLLEGDSVKDVMWWLPGGDAFCFVPVLFAEKVLDVHFQGTKFESFTRKLNRWGFKRVAGQKVPANTVAYYHTLFHKGKPDRIKDMSGGKHKSGSPEKKKPSQSGRTRNNNVKAAPKPTLMADSGLVTSEITNPSLQLASEAEFGRDSGLSFLFKSQLGSSESVQQQAERIRAAEQSLATQQSLDIARQASIAELRMRLLSDSSFRPNPSHASDNAISRLLLGSDSGAAGRLQLETGSLANVANRIMEQAQPGNSSITQLLTRGAPSVEGAHLLSSELASRILSQRLAGTGSTDLSTDFAARLMAGRGGAMDQRNISAVLASQIVGSELLNNNPDTANLILARQLGVLHNNKSNFMLSSRFLPQQIGVVDDSLQASNESNRAMLMAAQQRRSSDMLGSLNDPLPVMGSSSVTHNQRRLEALEQATADRQLLERILVEQQRIQQQRGDNTQQGDKKLK